MNIPQELTQALATALASPQDRLAMRVIARRVANQALYRLHGKRRSYVLAYCPTMRVHFIDVPVSVWSDGIDPERPYEDNFSVAHDIQANFAHAESLVMFPVPFAAAMAADESPEPEAPVVRSTAAERMRALRAERKAAKAKPA